MRSSNLTTTRTCWPTLVRGIPSRLGLQVVSPLRWLLLYLLHFPESFHIRKQYPADGSPLTKNHVLIRYKSLHAAEGWAGAGRWGHGGPLDAVASALEKLSTRLACPFRGLVTYCQLGGLFQCQVRRTTESPFYVPPLPLVPGYFPTSDWFSPDKLTHRK